MYSPIHSLIEHEGVRDPLTCSEGDDAERCVKRINLYEHLEAVSVVGDATHREKEMRPFAQVLTPDRCHNVVSVEPTAAVAFEPKSFAIAGSGASMPEHARQPTRQTINFCLGTRNGVIPEPVLWTFRQICDTKMAFASLRPDFSELSAQPLVVIVESARVPVAAISGTGVASNQSNVRDRDVVSSDGFNKVRH
jgi:hypothetical protein